jgi:hypothetical protein
MCRNPLIQIDRGMLSRCGAACVLAATTDAQGRTTTPLGAVARAELASDLFHHNGLDAEKVVADPDFVLYRKAAIPIF